MALPASFHMASAIAAYSVCFLDWSFPIQVLPSTVKVDWVAQRRKEIEMKSSNTRKVYLIATSSISALRADHLLVNSDKINSPCQGKMWCKMIIIKRNCDYFLILPNCVVRKEPTRRRTRLLHTSQFIEFWVGVVYLLTRRVSGGTCWILP
jgi:hypothetical protein